INSICLLPSDGGVCRGRFTNYYYNSRTRRCETFRYGGCGGNANNFHTLRQCQATCYSS
uniref:PI-actitoxin-Axm2b n=1 Tax=Anthopleura aff. xanthogrammica TaxID=152178 RepID=VKT2_ANTAF|nr:RecName: Full=PI-actitoxin-Axm2b; Short=PI-AITX-Axm2b; AltName: Full=Kunitz-type proteinase inhibitor AXPI-II [Anthopleura aff. xanthogrammica]